MILPNLDIELAKDTIDNLVDFAKKTIVLCGVVGVVTQGLLPAGDLL